MNKGFDFLILLKKIRENTTSRWHSQLHQKNGLYGAWHKHPHHHHIHLAVFFFALFFSISSIGISYSSYVKDIRADEIGIIDTLGASVLDGIEEPVIEGPIAEEIVLEEFVPVEGEPAVVEELSVDEPIATEEALADPEPVEGSVAEEEIPAPAEDPAPVVEEPIVEESVPIAEEPIVVEDSEPVEGPSVIAVQESKFTREFQPTKNSNLSCQASPFISGIKSGETKNISIAFFGFDAGLPHSLYLGNMPGSIEAKFISSNDSVISQISGDGNAEVILSAQAGVQQGTFTLPIILTEGPEESASDTICQFAIETQK